ncbi:MAG: sulfite dehydrogenase [Hyphomicrobiaceae bacterium]
MTSEKWILSDEVAAAGGLLHRRSFLKSSTVVLSGIATAGLSTGEAVAVDGPEWMKKPGAPLRQYGSPSPFESTVKRAILQPYGEMAQGTGVALTPLQYLRGSITPNGLHFERSHNGVPQIDPDKHKFLIHGLVKNPLVFSMDSLLRYPMVSTICFIECAGNSFFNSNLFEETMQVPVGHLHGLISAAEWTGVRLSTLLEEAGADMSAKWLLAEGGDAVGMSRSIPMEKALDDVIVALYQNGERIRPEQGYPMRLVLPGFEGNMSVKWLRRIKVQNQPTYTKDETSKYTDLRPDGKADLFTYTMGAKSTITYPATGLRLKGAGVYEISGLAWSGHGAVKRVEVSADGGKSWAEAKLDEPVRSRSLTRFRLLWNWDGRRATLQSRTIDTKGNTQPSHADWSASYAAGQLNHCNAIQSFMINTDGSITNVLI